jgi:putative SOS response-associated peptidase YedK
MLAADEYQRWLDCSHTLDASDPVFRSELKETLRLQALPRAVGNARNKDPALQAGLGDVIELRRG